MTAVAEPRSPALVDATPEPDEALVRSPEVPVQGLRLPTSVAVLVHSCAALAWVGMYTFYGRVWIAPREGMNGLVGDASAVVDGTASAPFQYRILVPQVLMWLNRELGWQIGFAAMVLDALMLAIGVAAIHLLMRRLDLEIWVLPVAVYGAFVMVGMLWWGKFETLTSFAAMSVVTWAMLRDDRRRWIPMAIGALVLAGTRTDLLLAAGVALGARWLFAGRRTNDLIAAIGLAATGVVATIGLIAAYPDARYETTGLFQITHNVQFVIALTAVAFLLPALGPYVLVRSQPALRSVISEQRSVMVPLLALVAAEIGSVLIVGRAEEVRLFVPITGALGILAVVGWRTILAPYSAALRDSPG